MTNLQEGLGVSVTDLGNHLLNHQHCLWVFLVFFIPHSQLAKPSISKSPFPALTCKCFLITAQNKSTAFTHWAALWPRASSQPLRIRAWVTQYCIYPAHPECFKLLPTARSPYHLQNLFSHCIHLNLTRGQHGEPISHVRYHSHFLTQINLNLKRGRALKILYLFGTCTHPMITES